MNAWKTTSLRFTYCDYQWLKCNETQGNAVPPPPMYGSKRSPTSALAAKYHIEPHDVVRSSVARIKDSFWFYFSELV